MQMGPPFHCVLNGREREDPSLWVSLLIKTLILIDRGSTLMTLFNLNYCLIGPLSKHRHNEGRTSTHAFGGFSP